MRVCCQMQLFAVPLVRLNHCSALANCHNMRPRARILAAMRFCTRFAFSALILPVCALASAQYRPQRMPDLPSDRESVIPCGKVMDTRRLPASLAYVDNNGL